jgi:hypothetical protein
VKFDDQLDEALRRLPAWTPPPYFAERMSRRVSIRDESQAMVPRVRFWIGAILQGMVAAGIGFLASTVVSLGATSLSGAGRAAVDEYLRVVLPSNNALPLAWMCTGGALLVALMSTRRSLT